jgi:hypothetical protein
MKKNWGKGERMFKCFIGGFLIILSLSLWVWDMYVIFYSIDYNFSNVGQNRKDCLAGREIGLIFEISSLALLGIAVGLFFLGRGLAKKTIFW